MKRALLVLAALLAAGLLIAGALVVPTFTAVPRLFKRNAELKAQGYYLGEFEFKMESCYYYLIAGDYVKAFRTLRRIEHEMETLDGLARFPDQATPDQLIDFMLDRQDPATGAFMPPGYPLFSFIGPTANALDFLDTLSRQTGRPIKLKYPLRFLDKISRPSDLHAFLDTFLYISPVWADRFGGPAPYVAVSELTPETLDLYERVGGYRFSAEWKRALLDWFYATQDPATGFWGARVGSPRRFQQSLDIDSTSHILKLFLDERGQVRDPRYPLRYADALARTLLGQTGAGVPDSPVEQHEWMLRQGHAAKIFVRFLWPTLSPEMRGQVLRAMPGWIETRFRMYRPAEGGFAIDADSPHADVDATVSAVSFLRILGAVPGWERERLWGAALAAGPTRARATLEDATMVLRGMPVANSVRVYRDAAPAADNWDDANLLLIAHPRPTPVPDLMEVRLGLARFIAAEGGQFGNWNSKAELRDGPMGLDRAARPVPVAPGWPDLARVAAEHPEAARFFVIGCDVFQVPVFAVEVTR